MIHDIDWRRLARHVEAHKRIVLALDEGDVFDGMTRDKRAILDAALLALTDEIAHPVGFAPLPNMTPKLWREMRDTAPPGAMIWLMEHWPVHFDSDGNPWSVPEAEQ
jgi:hypothetical protein